MNLAIVVGVPVVSAVIGLAVIYRLVYVLNRGVRPPPAGQGSELLPMDQEHRVALLVWVRLWRNQLGGAALAALVFISGMGVYLGWTVPDPLLIVTTFGVVSIAVAAFTAYYARSMMGTRADDLAAGLYARAWGPATVVRRGGEISLRTATRSLPITEAVAIAIENAEIIAVDYAPLSDMIFQIWGAGNRAIYHAEKFHVTKNLPARAGS